MNIRRSDGTWFDANEVGTMLLQQNVQVRTGSLCNPAGMAKALGWPAESIKSAYAAGHRCSQQRISKVQAKPFGMVRLTLGPSSTLMDVESTCVWIEKLFIG
jgi:molybdenum cofactor sulfurtransferase